MAVVAALSCALAEVTRATAQANMSVEVSSARTTRVSGAEVPVVGADDGADELTGITGPSLAAVHASVKSQGSEVKSHSLASVALYVGFGFGGLVRRIRVTRNESCVSGRYGAYWSAGGIRGALAGMPTESLVAHVGQSALFHEGSEPENARASCREK